MGDFHPEIKCFHWFPSITFHTVHSSLLPLWLMPTDMEVTCSLPAYLILLRTAADFRRSKKHWYNSVHHIDLSIRIIDTPRVCRSLPLTSDFFNYWQKKMFLWSNKAVADHTNFPQGAPTSKVANLLVCIFFAENWKSKEFGQLVAPGGVPGANSGSTNAMYYQGFHVNFVTTCCN